MKVRITEQSRALDNVRGRVRITVRLVTGEGRNVVGNVTRTITVDGARVTEIAEWIQRKLPKWAR